MAQPKIRYGWQVGAGLFQQHGDARNEGAAPGPGRVPEQRLLTTGLASRSVFPKPAKVGQDQVPGLKEPWESSGEGLLNLTLGLALRAWPRASDPPAPRAPCFRAQGSLKLQEPKISRGFLVPLPVHLRAEQEAGRRCASSSLRVLGGKEPSTACFWGDTSLTHSFILSLICNADTN